MISMFRNMTDYVTQMFWDPRMSIISVTACNHLTRTCARLLYNVK